MTDERYLRSVFWSEPLWQNEFWDRLDNLHPNTSRWATPCFRGLVGAVEGALLPLSNAIVALVFPFFSHFKDEKEYLQGAKIALSFVVAYCAVVGFLGLGLHAMASSGFYASLMGGLVLTSVLFGVMGCEHRISGRDLSEAYVPSTTLTPLF